MTDIELQRLGPADIVLARRTFLVMADVFGLAAAYQLIRYGGRTLAPAERTRAQPRLRALRDRLRR